MWIHTVILEKHKKWNILEFEPVLLVRLFSLKNEQIWKAYLTLWNKISKMSALVSGEQLYVSFSCACVCLRMCAFVFSNNQILGRRTIKGIGTSWQAQERKSPQYLGQWWRNGRYWVSPALSEPWLVPVSKTSRKWPCAKPSKQACSARQEYSSLCLCAEFVFPFPSDNVSKEMNVLCRGHVPRPYSKTKRSCKRPDILRFLFFLEKLWMAIAVIGVCLGRAFCVWVSYPLQSHVSQSRCLHVLWGWVAQ